MNLNQDNINQFIDKYVLFVNNLSDQLHYDSNIRHLLYLIVPAFVLKYGVNNEKTIEDCFRNVKVYVNSTFDDLVTATFNRTLKKGENGYYTDKFILINNFKESNLSVILDNIVHEFNHAINSINNEVICEDKIIRVRTGLSTINYDKETLKFINKSKEVALEEILNTAQTEDVINIINSFGNYSINNSELSNTLYTLKREIGSNKYSSDGYRYQKEMCSILINNKTFAPTINNLRFKGLIDDIPLLFDNVVEEGCYKKLNELLTDIHSLIIVYSKRKFFKNSVLNKIRNKSSIVSSIINEYEKKCIFK